MLTNDLGILAQGIGTRMKTGINRIKFIHPKHILAGKKVTYYKLVASIRPLKVEKNRVRVTIGGDRLDNNRNKSTIPATLTMIKIHLNSTISTKDTRYMTTDIKNFYYGTLIQDYEYGHLPLELVPKEVKEQYNLHKLASNNKVYFKIQKGMPGLKQAGIITHNRL